MMTIIRLQPTNAHALCDSRRIAQTSRQSALSVVRSSIRAMATCLGLGVASLAGAHAQTTSTPQPVLVADFNHDGIPDALILSTTAPTATIAFGSVPYGTFSAASKVVTFPGACTSLPQGSVLAGDFNNDGIADIAYFCGQSANGVMLGNGDGTFGTAKTFYGISSSIEFLGDFNNDGKLDIAAVGVNGTDDTFPSIAFFPGNGDGTFGTPVFSTYNSSTSYIAAAIADVNVDGYPDILALSYSANGTPSVDIFGNNKNGTFGTGTDVAAPNTSVSVPGATAASTILVGNFFGKSPTDFVVPIPGSSPSAAVVQNTSTAATYSFADPATVTLPLAFNSALAGTFTGSGFTDLVLGSSTGTGVTVLANDGTGNFAATYSALTANVPSLYAMADANGDGYSDIYTATLPQTGALQLAVSITTGTATATSQAFSLGIGSQNIAASWNGNVNFLASTASGTQIVTGAITATVVNSSKNPSLLGDSVTFTATVVPAITGATPTGTVVFLDGATQLSTVALDATGTAAYTTAALTQSTHPITAMYSGDGYYATSTSPILSQVVNHAPAVAPILTWATPAPIIYGTALSSTQLDAAATDATTGAAVPGTYTYTPAAGTIPAPGTQTLSVAFVPTDTLSYTNAAASVSLTVNGVTVASFTPNTANLGDPATKITLTGLGFVSNSVVQVNGTAIPTTVISATTLTAIVPASYFTSPGMLQITVADPGISQVSPPLTLTVLGPNVAATVTAPPTTPPGSQPTVTVTLTQPYPVDLVGTLTIGFARAGTPQITDPSLQFSGGGTTMSFAIPANTTTIPPIQLQAGTIAGTITVPLTLTAAGVNVTPANLAPATIVVPTAVPIVSGMTVTRSGSQLTVVMHGFSNTREVASAQFHFTAAAGATIGTPDLTLPADNIFNTNWFDTDASDAYGSTFTYTQIFNISDDATTVGSVEATLTNSVGASTMTTAQ